MLSQNLATPLETRNKAVEDLFRMLPITVRAELSKEFPNRNTEEARFKILEEGKKFEASLRARDPKSQSDILTIINISSTIKRIEELNSELGLTPPATSPTLAVTLPPSTPAQELALTRTQELEQARQYLALRFEETVKLLQGSYIDIEKKSGIPEPKHRPDRPPPPPPPRWIDRYRADFLNEQERNDLAELSKIKNPSQEDVEKLRAITESYFKKSGNSPDIPDTQAGPRRDPDRFMLRANFTDAATFGMDSQLEKIKALEPEVKAAQRAALPDTRSQAIEKLYFSLPENIREKLSDKYPDQNARSTEEARFKILEEAKKHAAFGEAALGTSYNPLVKLIEQIESYNKELGLTTPPVAPPAPVVLTPEQQQAKWESNYYDTRSIEGNNPDNKNGGLTKILSILDPAALKAIQDKYNYPDADKGEQVSDMLKAIQAAARKSALHTGRADFEPGLRQFMEQDPATTTFTLTTGALNAIALFTRYLTPGLPNADRAQEYLRAVNELIENASDKNGVS